MNNHLQQAALATKHGKELLFRPAFAAIDMTVVVAEIDTDQFGTFAGEVERQGSPRDIVERKARAATEVSGLSIGLASEGSFGPHPITPFLLADSEIVFYLDTQLEYCIFETERAISTVPAAAVVHDVDAIGALKITSSFPDQRAIVVTEDPLTKSRHVLAKGIDSTSELRTVVARALDDQPNQVIIEPDLRANHCPDRRKVIRSAIDRLITRLRVSCPRCSAIGFGPLRTIPGLRCGLCELPTTLSAADVMGCARCGFETAVARSGDADPTYCDRCNP